MIELLVVIAVISALFILFRLEEHGGRQGRQQTTCSNNMKQIGIALTAYTLEHEGMMPWQSASKTAGSDSSLADEQSRLEPWQYFMKLDHVLDAPRRLNCPDDVLRAQYRANSFRGNTDSLDVHRNLAVSYFIGLNGSKAHPQSLMLGDRNIVPEWSEDFRQSAQGTVSMVDPQTATWWTASSMSYHHGGGNIARYDGSVAFVSSEHLREALKLARDSYGTNANRFLFPQ